MIQRTYQPDTGMLQDILLVATFDVFVVNRLSGLTVDPAHVKGAIFKMTFEVFDVAHDPHHFDASLDREFTPRLHLPASTRASPWSHFTETIPCRFARSESVSYASR